MTRDGLAAWHVHILVRLDANHKIGLAHAIRVSAILDLLTVPYQVSVVGEGDLIANFFPGQQVFRVTADNNADFFSLIDELQPDIILIDHPQLGSIFWRLLRGRVSGIPIVAIDDEGGDVEADLIFNGTVLDQYHHYPLAGPQAMLMLGRAYTLIRPIFGTTLWQNPRKACVVIVVGSGDEASAWALQLMSGRVDLSSWGAVTMIVGRAFPAMSQLQSDCDGLGVSLASGLSGEHMASALSQASVALITGGMIVYEALAVGVPAIVFPQIENLIPEATWFAQRGCIVDLGYGGGMNTTLVSEAVSRLLASSSDRTAMSIIQRATIDGHGMQRTATEIDNLLRARASSAMRHFDKKSEPQL